MSDESLENEQIGERLYQDAARLFPICRSLTGNGVRETLRIIQAALAPSGAQGPKASLEIHEVASGTSALDWTVPEEWNIRDAFIADPDGTRIVDFSANNLHVLGYSTPVDGYFELDELDPHLYSIAERPDVIPYVTSYYSKRWGFCVSDNVRKSLRPGVKYHVVIDSEFKNGSLSYGELIIPGQVADEVFLSTYICHPSMANNNEVSGPVVLTEVARWLSLKPRRFTYRIVFIPETIGAIVYLSRHLETLKKNVRAGFNVSCVGDDRGYSMVASPYENTLADKVALNVGSFLSPYFKKYSFLERGSDERQYCSPGVELPVVTLCRSKFNEYPEYHTSLDDMNLISPAGFKGGFNFVKRCLEVMECNQRIRVTCFGEPQLGKRGLYPSLSTKGSASVVKSMMDLIAYADGRNDLIKISEIIKVPVWELVPIIEKLRAANLIESESA